MELTKVRLSYVNPSTGENKTAETYVAVYPDFGNHIVESASYTAMMGVVSDKSEDWIKWMVTVDYVERLGPVHIAKQDDNNNELDITK